MSLSAVGFASALALGSKLGSQAAAASVDFAQLLTQKLSGADEASTSKDKDKDPTESNLSKAFENSLLRFDGFLESIGLDPNSVRIIARESDGQPKVEVRSKELASWQHTSLRNWIETHDTDAENLNLPQRSSLPRL